MIRSALPLALLAATLTAATPPPNPVSVALADPARPAEDPARPTARHPEVLLKFAGIRPGMKVADFIMGGGYWTRILARTVGDRGKVYAYQPAEFIKMRASYGAEQDKAVALYPNVVPSHESLAELSFPEPLDAIITVENWHDLHLKVAPSGFAGGVARKLYAALKPGGVLLIADHVGPPGGAPFAVADTLHRGDPAATRAEVEAAGFRFEGESPVLRQPADPHTALVFDPAIRGKTDQFVYLFRKPK